MEHYTSAAGAAPYDDGASLLVHPALRLALEVADKPAAPQPPALPFDDKTYTLGYEVFLENRKPEDAWAIANAAVRQNPADMRWRERLAQVSEWTQRPAVALENWLAQELQKNERLIIMGDFNVTPEDRDSYDPVGLKDTIHHTVEERAHFQRMLDLGLTDAYRMFDQPEKSYSWWDYRMLGFQKNRGLRIDHILVSNALKNTVTACTIDRVPRKNKQPSDHTPVVVTLG